jgi:hypothetical protein
VTDSKNIDRVRNAKVEGSIPFRSTIYTVDSAGFARYLPKVPRATNVLLVGPASCYVARHGARHVIQFRGVKGKPTLRYVDDATLDRLL